ncbi:uncharacterized protein PITG_10181 [Phytophthora infestans T30-4]|uniref:Uncharacterized protein n=1 Tax=Phytophthora infestans (strain T30-4) TaxID=403677 RepID=D0NEI7_PHYIT|nr:uncharacterized protein PITG_10181 [Phytophthora infestans T30-4]EEY56632.1 conserved hypothetical protein [Phytophthora infestans T30-4]|eukprot:XP_002902706.1 conserved hypothetical protein [Phytophthora infestans T30-4]
MPLELKQKHDQVYYKLYGVGQSAARNFKNLFGEEGSTVPLLHITSFKVFQVTLQEVVDQLIALRRTGSAVDASSLSRSQATEVQDQGQFHPTGAQSSIHQALINALDDDRELFRVHVFNKNGESVRIIKSQFSVVHESDVRVNQLIMRQELRVASGKAAHTTINRD